MNAGGGAVAEGAESLIKRKSGAKYLEVPFICCTFASINNSDRFLAGIASQNENERVFQGVAAFCAAL